MLAGAGATGVAAARIHRARISLLAKIFSSQEDHPWPGAPCLSENTVVARQGHRWPVKP